METKRFLMITTHFPPYHLGGDAVFVDYLSKELVRRGHEVHVLHTPTVYGIFREIDNSITEQDTHDGIQRHSYLSPDGALGPLRTLALGSCARAMRTTVNLSKVVKPDVVHWHNTRGFMGMPSILGNEVSIYTSHDYGAVCPRSNLLRPNLEVCDEARMCTICSMRWKKPPQLWRIGSRRVLKFPENTKITTPSQFVADRLRSEGVAVHRVLRNFVPDPGARSKDSTQNYDTLVYLGMLEIHKGLRTLVRAFIKTKDEQRFRLDIIGEGTLRSELTDIVATTGLSDRITVHGFLDRNRAESLRNRAAAQIVPSQWFENCPLTILEAFALGVPVIGSDMGGIPEIVSQDSGSRTFKGGDVDALSATLIDMWNRREELESCGKKARIAYDNRFRPEGHLAEYMKTVEHS